MLRPAQISVLGGFQLTVGDRVVPLPLQSQRLLTLLVVHHAVPTRSTLAATLWEDVPDRRAQANLRNAVWRIRLAADTILRCTRYTVRLHESAVVDLEQAQRTAHALLGDGPADCRSPCVDLLERDLLPAWDEEWLVIERERHRQLRLHALEALSAARCGAGHWSDAITAALAAVRAEPLRESAQRALIVAHLGEGNVIEAVRQRESYRQLLDGELGIAPSRSLESMVDAALRAAPVTLAR